MLTLFIVVPFCLSQIYFYASAQGQVLSPRVWSAKRIRATFFVMQSVPIAAFLLIWTKLLRPMTAGGVLAAAGPIAFVRLLLEYVRLESLTFFLDECGGGLSGRTGFLVFPGYPRIYNPNEYCTWTFDYPSTTTILVRFISISLRQRDYVEIDDVQFRSNALPYSYVGELNSNDRIIFSSEAYGGKGHGFLLQYQAISGKAMHDARLSALTTSSFFLGTPPQFSFVSSDRVVLRKGASLALFCRARGTPAPSVRWEQDGKAVNASAGAPTGEELHRDSVQISDAGIYECVAENALGVVRRSFFLAIHGKSLQKALICVVDFLPSSAYYYKFACRRAFTILFAWSTGVFSLRRRRNSQAGHTVDKSDFIHVSLPDF